MFKFKTISFAILAFATVWHIPSTAEAGPLLDWFLGRRCCRRPVCFQPQRVVAASPCQTTCTQTCQRTVVNYVPYTAYRTSWEAVPVTSYRPQSNTDPCTGCTVTCMRPCTNYTYRAKQTPYTTYRPVYSTQAYQVPITYAAQAPIAASGCNSCGVPQQQYQIQQPAVTVPTITGAIGTNGSYTTVPSTTSAVPADTQPALNPQTSQRPIYIEQPTPATGTSSRLNSPTTNQTWPSNSNLNPIQTPQQGTQQYQPPQLFDVDAKTAQATEIKTPVYRRFDYSPVRTASHVQSTPAQPQRSVVYTGTIQRGNQASAPQKQQVNQGWRSMSK